MASIETQTESGSLFAPQSPDPPYPVQFLQAHQESGPLIDASKNERHPSLDVDEQLQDESMPWWQMYYDMYNYSAPPGRRPIVFGPYLLMQTLGEGEFGKVKLGVHVEHGYEVAVKLMKKDHIDSSSRMSKVEREISVLMTVRHPYIVKLYDVIETDKYIGIILQCASGGELFEYILAHRYLKEKDASRLFAQVISGVQYLHQKHIVHRDLKLENLLLDRNRSVVITDFGFANQFTSAQDDLMQTSCGSPCYAAPELVVSEGMYVGTAVDIWSCGVILYAMLCGYLPFDDDPANPESDNINLLYKYILTTPLVFPDYISAEAQDLLRRMLVPDPTKRCTIEAIMNHPWLSAHCDLFDKSLEDLEQEAIASSPYPYMPAPSKQEDTKQPNPEEAHVPADNEAMDVDDQHVPDDAAADPRTVVGSCDVATPIFITEDTQAKDQNKDNVPDKGDAVVPEDSEEKRTVSSVVDLQEASPADQQQTPSLHPVNRDSSSKLSSEQLPNVSCLELPASVHTDESPASSSLSLVTDDRDVNSDHQGDKPSDHVTPSSSVHGGKKAHPADKLLSFLSGSQHATASHRKSPRPTSMLNYSGSSILQAKFLSSVQRRVSLSRHDKDHVLRLQSMSTPPGGQQQPREPPPKSPSVHSQTITGSSLPVRGTRRKALSLLVKPVTDYLGEDKPRKSVYTSTQDRALGEGMQTYSKDTMTGMRTSSPWNLAPSISEHTTTDKERHKSAGKKLMGWFKKKQGGRNRSLSQSAYGDMLSPSPIATTSAIGQSAHGTHSQRTYIVDATDIKLRSHHGAVDQAALTSRPPTEVFTEIKQALLTMGIEAKHDGEYRLKCTRRKRAKDERKPLVQRLLYRRSVNASKIGESVAKYIQPDRRPVNPHHPAVVVSNESTTLYGDPSVDPADEVRFTVEMCKIKNLPGLYIVDIRRLRGNLWSYKFLYHALFDAINLNSHNACMTTTLQPAVRHPPMATLHEQVDTNGGPSHSIPEEANQE